MLIKTPQESSAYNNSYADNNFTPIFNVESKLETFFLGFK